MFISEEKNQETLYFSAAPTIQVMAGIHPWQKIEPHLVVGDLAAGQ
jgi:hypothetical protein